MSKLDISRSPTLVIIANQCDYKFGIPLYRSTQPKAMATSQIDSDWSTYVYWVVANSIWAEENSITSEDFRQVPEVKFFGDRFEWMFIGSTFATGNYGEIYERNAEDLPPRTNHNLLNDGSSPQLWRPEFDV